MQPLWADFNDCDDDGAVLMGAPPFVDMHLQETDFVPTVRSKNLGIRR